jgi:uncharacterized protein YacL
MDWKTILIIVIMTLSFADLLFTFYYVHEYKKWQPQKNYNLIELNPLLVFLWTKLGFVIGHIVGSIIILSLVYIVARYSHWTIALLLLIVLIFAMFNHANNIQLLWKLIEKYPTGYLPVETFGVVQGSNPK